MTNESVPGWQANTVANLQKARKTNGRLGSKKSRAGCVTCKIRHVKCDEAKPACNRCQSTGRICDGYSDISPRAKDPDLNPAVSHISTLALKQKELQDFDYFLSLAAPRLSGGLDHDFWCGRVLQLCHAEAHVRYAALAMSILYRYPQYLQRFSVNLEGDVHLPNAERIKLLGTGDPFGNYRIDENHALALKYYNRAIAAFKKQIEAGKATPLQAVLSCMLFMNIEMMRDSVLDVIELFTQSVKLMRQTLATADHTDPLVKWLKQAFTRIGVLAATFGHPQSMDIPPVYIEDPDQAAFPSLDVARTALFSIMANSHAFLKDASEYKDSVVAHEEEEMAVLEKHMTKTGSLVWPDTVETDNSPVGYAHLINDDLDNLNDLLQGRRYVVGTHEPERSDTPTQIEDGIEQTAAKTKLRKRLDSLKRQDRHHAEQLEQWYESFFPLAETNFATQPDVVSNLHIWYHVSLVWLNTRLEPEQTAFEQHTWRFEQIIHYADIYVSHIEARNTVFTMEVGVVPQLYLTASKCRIPSLRRRALALLQRGPRKEAIWGAGSTWELAATLIWFEERGLGLPSPFEPFEPTTWEPDWDTRSPPEHQRVHNLQILKNLIHLRFDVEITTIEHDPSGRRRKVVVEVPIGSQCFSRDVRESEREVYHGPGGVGSLVSPKGAVLSGHGEVVFSEFTSPQVRDHAWTQGQLAYMNEQEEKRRAEGKYTS